MLIDPDHQRNRRTPPRGAKTVPHARWRSGSTRPSHTVSHGRYLLSNGRPAAPAARAYYAARRGGPATFTTSRSHANRDTPSFAPRAIVPISGHEPRPAVRPSLVLYASSPVTARLRRRVGGSGRHALVLARCCWLVSARPGVW